MKIEIMLCLLFCNILYKRNPQLLSCIFIRNKTFADINIASEKIAMAILSLYFDID